MLLKLKADGTSWTEIAKLLDNGMLCLAPGHTLTHNSQERPLLLVETCTQRL